MLKRSGSKTIAVDGQRCRYVFTDAAAKTSGDHAPLAIAVQHAEADDARLHITGLSTWRVPEELSKFYGGRTVDRPL